MNQKVLIGSHIFIVEDDHYMRHVMDHFFSNNYVTSMFDNGMTAIASMQNGIVPDLIIADLNTPVLNGLELIAQIKSSGFFNSIPIIIVSGDQASDKKIKCLAAGADDYVLKPFNPTELEIRVNIALKRSGSNYSLMNV